MRKIYLAILIVFLVSFGAIAANFDYMEWGYSVKDVIQLENSDLFITREDEEGLTMLVYEVDAFGEGVEWVMYYFMDDSLFLFEHLIFLDAGMNNSEDYVAEVLRVQKYLKQNYGEPEYNGSLKLGNTVATVIEREDSLIPRSYWDQGNDNWIIYGLEQWQSDDDQLVHKVSYVNLTNFEQLTMDEVETEHKGSNWLLIGGLLTMILILVGLAFI